MSPDEPDLCPAPKSASRGVKVLLWTVALLAMLATAIYQRQTGPTYPMKGTVEIAGQEIRYKLIRSDWSNRSNDATRIVIPNPVEDSTLTATLHYRRYRTDDPFTAVAMTRETVDEEAVLSGSLPPQPAAGKLEYTIALQHDAETGRIPADTDEMVVIRFKDDVPTAILLPHILLMFFAMLFGLRAGIGAFFDPGAIRFHARVAFVGMTVGGMVLGPIVQKYAFGAYWTGFPLGGDWTDNKMLVMWLAWVIAFAILEFRGKRAPRAGRIVVILAAVVMVAVYLIPHSTRGSELDYSQIDRGVDPSEAVETGR
jgi:hypothetical protein